MVVHGKQQYTSDNDTQCGRRDLDISVAPKSAPNDPLLTFSALTMRPFDRDADVCRCLKARDVTMLLPDKNLWRAGRETHPSLEAPSDARAAWLCGAAPFCIWLSIVVCILSPEIFCFQQRSTL